MTTGSRYILQPYPLPPNWAGGSQPFYSFSKSWSGSNGIHSFNSWSMNLVENDLGYYYGYEDAYKAVGSPKFPFSKGMPGGPVDFYQVSAAEELAFSSKVVSVIKGHKFNAGVALAESKEALELIVQTAETLCSTVRSLRHGDVLGAAKHLGLRRHPKSISAPTSLRDAFARGYSSSRAYADWLSSAWLALQFGYKPLLNDVYQAGEALAAKTARPTIDRVKVTQRWVGTYEYESPSSPYFFHVNQWRARTVIVTLAEQPSDAWRMGLTNPANVAWNLVPFSFVADWFAPIGTYLETRGSIADLSVSCVYSEKAFTQSIPTSPNMALISPPGSYPPIVVLGNSGTSFKAVQCSRGTFQLANVPLPQPTGLNTLADWWKGVTSVALLSTLTKDLHRPV